LRKAGLVAEESCKIEIQFCTGDFEEMNNITVETRGNEIPSDWI
jgi:hypothetical protein